MTLTGMLIFCWFILLALFQLFLTLQFRKAFLVPRPDFSTQRNWPSVLAVMALRGGDETILETLTRLTTLDYPNYHVRIVIDSPDDPVRDVVQQVIDHSGENRIEALILPERRSTCSGKISGVLFGTENLPEDCQVVAIFDGDAILHPGCLKDLVLPLTAGVSLTTGNRWYSPPATIGAMTRSLWNGLAVTMMSWTRIPWGGCMAMDASIIRDPELRERLSNAFGEDSTLGTFLLEKKRNIQFVPDAVIVNTEDCTLTGFYRFLLRQYLTVRINNPIWPVVLIANVLLGLTAVLANFLLLIPFQQRTTMSLGYLILIFSLIIELGVGSLLIRRQQSQSGTPIALPSIAHIALFPIALVGLNYLNFFATIHAALTRTHSWRGITYRFPPQGGCELVDVQSLGSPETTEQNASPLLEDSLST